jgi:hypothetical protein
MSKEDLFLNEIESLCYAYSGISYWDVYHMPVSVRKFFIKTFLKRQEQEQKNNGDDTSTPLTPAEKARFIQKSQQVNVDTSRFMSKKT